MAIFTILPVEALQPLQVNSPSCGVYSALALKGLITKVIFIAFLADNVSAIQILLYIKI